jgi:hypothetical protein
MNTKVNIRVIRNHSCTFVDVLHSPFTDYHYISVSWCLCVRYCRKFTSAWRTGSGGGLRVGRIFSVLPCGNRG